MITEAIILAGGLGTRLRSAVPELPKCMAPVLAKPFIGYVIDYLYTHGVRRFIFSLGYKADLLQQYLNTQYSNLNIVFSTEAEPLGTGGAIRLACPLVHASHAFVVNGDTFFKIDLLKLACFHILQGAGCTLSVKPVNNSDRYGGVALNDNNTVKAFTEKGHHQNELINGGVYVLDTGKFLAETLPGTFSFEKDYLEKYVGENAFYAFVHDGYFIDIGIPEAYERAQTELILHL